MLLKYSFLTQPFSSIFNNAPHSEHSLYPVLALKYIISSLEAHDVDDTTDSSSVDLYSFNVWTRWLMLTAMIVLLGCLNYKGITFVSSASAVICFLSNLPFIVLICYCIPKVDVSRWFVVPEGGHHGLEGVRWTPFLNILFWNLNYWDSSSMFSGDVNNPGKTFPRAMAYAVLMVALGYIVMLLVGIGASGSSWKEWNDGYFEVVGRQVAGRW